MNFFQHQDVARRKSAQLVLLLSAAVIALIAITTIALAAFLYFFESHTTSIQAVQAHQYSFWQHFLRVLLSEKVLWICLGVTSVVGIGSFYKTRQLKQGGDYVAQALGGRPLITDNAPPSERVLLNVVEEMAIASGMPVPRVYLLEENGINAFAAGNDTSSAVIGITRGCIETLSREQLQGVIAHEFSHIHHGDMRLNMKLISVLHGILVIGLIGEFIMRSNSRRSYHSSKNKKGNQTAVLGLALMAIGFTGVMFGNMIKAAVSRQREYLADASAVQFTRNPEGIAAALLKIQRRIGGSQLSTRGASEFSHFFFANGVSSFFSKIFATHPPLDDRIARVFPRGAEQLQKKLDSETPRQTDADFERSPSATTEPENSALGSAESTAKTPSKENTASLGNALNITGNSPTPIDINALLLSIGQVDTHSLAFSQALIASIPAALYNACHSTYQARAVVYALLLETKDSGVRQQQIKHLSSRAHPATYKEFIKVYQLVDKLDKRLYFPVLQLAQPVLLQMSGPQRTLFEKNLRALAEADSKISLAEWTIMTYLLRPVQRVNNSSSQTLNGLKKEIETLLGFTCRLNERHQQQASLDEALGSLWPEHSIPVPSAIKLKSLDHALSSILQLEPLQKPRVMKALALCMNHDGIMSLRETEVLRAVGAVLDCPIPIQPEAC